MAQILTMTREAVAAYRDLLNALMDLVGGFRPRRRGRPKGDAPVPLRVRHVPPELHNIPPRASVGSPGFLSLEAVEELAATSRLQIFQRVSSKQLKKTSPRARE